MVARYFILFILLTIAPDIYIDYRYLRDRQPIGSRLLWFLPSVAIVLLMCHMANQPRFVPHNYALMELFMLLLGVIVIPKALFAICSALGWGHNAFHHTSQSWGERIGLIAAIASAVAFVYGLTLGANQIRVHHITLYSPNLPATMDGYRIAHLSDLHVGTYNGWRKTTLKGIVDSVNAQHPDLVCFTGDLQNAHPEEIESIKELIDSNAFAAPVVSVLGNHDYSKYSGLKGKAKQQLEKRVVAAEREQLGWRLLCNQNYRPCPTRSPLFYVVGTENDGNKRFVNRADYKQAIRGIPTGAYVLMLQHDPSAWQRNILDSTTAQLTLSGHTHGGQLSLLGLRPTMLSNAEDKGLYTRDNRHLYVSSGAGGVVPFRLAMPPEITIITLKHS